MRCEEARAALLAGELGTSEQKAVEAHLAGCRACRAEEPRFVRLRALISSPSLWESASDDLGDRIVRTIGQGIEKPQRSRVGWAAAAAAILVVAAGGFGLTQLLQGEPDWSIDLATIAPVPEAIAVVDGWVTSTGTRIVVEVAGISDAPSGYYYEIWLSAPDGRHVSAGTFTGAGRVTAFAGVRRSDFPRVWITLEQIGGDLGPSLQTYFDMPSPENRPKWPQGV